MTYAVPPTFIRRRRFGGLTHHQIASKISPTVHYDGDVNGWDHGGFYFDLATAEDYVHAVEIGWPDWDPDRHDGDRFIEVMTINLTDADDATIAKELGCEAGDVTIFHRVHYSRYRGGREPDDYYTLPMASFEPRRGDHKCDHVWTENQANNFVARLLGY